MTRELQEILARVEQLEPGTSAVLATVVDVRGSSYRLPGAKMLILENGQTFGMVSGGCLEADVLERAKHVLKTGESRVFTYDTTNDENSVFSLNMGCRGVIRIFLEPVIRENEYLDRLRAAIENRDPRCIATLISADTSSGVNIGGRAFCSRAGEFELWGLPHDLEKLTELQSDCVRLLSENGTSQIKSYETSQDVFEFFLEVAKPSISLLIFGAGADAVPLAEIAQNIGWHVTVVDHRPAYLANDRFAGGSSLILTNSEEFPDEIIADGQTAAVVMSHNYERDRAMLSNLLESEAFYIGVLGPKRRTEKLLAELNGQGEGANGKQPQNLYAPIGLDIGAETPEGIALSILAEIQGVLKNRDGGHLRDRQGSIYDRNE